MNMIVSSAIEQKREERPQRSGIVFMCAELCVANADYCTKGGMLLWAMAITVESHQLVTLCLQNCGSFNSQMLSVTDFQEDYLKVFRGGGHILLCKMLLRYG